MGGRKMKTCTVTARVYLGEQCEYDFQGAPHETRIWKDVDIMNTSRTRAWVTRQFNLHWKWRKRDVPIRVTWECLHDADPFYRFTGFLSGVNSIKTRRGVFED